MPGPRLPNSLLPWVLPAMLRLLWALARTRHRGLGLAAAVAALASLVLLASRIAGGGGGGHGGGHHGGTVPGTYTFNVIGQAAPPGGANVSRQLPQSSLLTLTVN